MGARLLRRRSEGGGGGSKEEGGGKGPRSLSPRPRPRKQPEDAVTVIDSKQPPVGVLRTHFGGCPGDHAEPGTLLGAAPCAWAPPPGPSTMPSRPQRLPPFYLPKARLLATRDPVKQRFHGCSGSTPEAKAKASVGTGASCPRPGRQPGPATHCFQTAPRCSAGPGCSRRRAGPRPASRRGCGAGSGWPAGSAVGAAALWETRAQEGERRQSTEE